MLEMITIVRSNGSPTYNKYPSTLKMATKKIPIATTYTSKEASIEKYSMRTKTNPKDSTTNKSIMSMDISQKILSNFMLDYDVVEYLEKMEENIMVFELFKIPQLREKLHKALRNIQGSQDMMFEKTKATPQGKNQKVDKMTKT